jgi:hypothetical protein
MEGGPAVTERDVNDPTLPFDDQFCCGAQRSFSVSIR